MSTRAVRKILFVTLSNLGDVVLTLPVFDTLAALYPDARITVMVGPRAKEVFEGNRRVDELIIYDKHAALGVKTALFCALSRERFDAVIDMKNSFFGAFLPAHFRTSPFVRIPAGIRHMRERNLYRVYKALRMDVRCDRHERSFTFSPDDKQAMDDVLFTGGVLNGTPLVVVNPSAAGLTRRWPVGNFCALCSRLAQRCVVVLTGSSTFKDVSLEITRACASQNVIDLTGRTTLRQFAYLCSRATAVVSADTGALHIASYMGAPLVGLFGAGDERRYGPWSPVSVVVTASLACRPCQVAQCSQERLRCMESISPGEVMDALDAVIERAAKETRDV